MEQVADAPNDVAWGLAAPACDRLARLTRRSVEAAFAAVYARRDDADAGVPIAVDADAAFPMDGAAPGRATLPPPPDPRGDAALSFVSQPIMLADQTIGLLCVRDHAGRRFDDRDREILALVAADIADHVAAAVERCRMEGAEAQMAVRGETLNNLALSLRDHLRVVATVSQHLPLTDDDAGAPQAGAQEGSALDEPHREGAVAGARILLADDLDLNRKLISDMLSIDGHQVDCVEDGRQAVAALAQRPYDLVLMDVVMPGLDGLAATRAIRALPPPACGVPILALTANAYGEQLQDCLDAGMDATLVKPMSLDALSAAVRVWVGRRHTRAA